MRPFIVAIVSLLALPVGGQVAGNGRPVQVVVSGGLQVPTGSFGDVHDAGLHADVSLLVKALGLRLRPELSYSRFNVKETLRSALGQVGPQGGQGGRRDDTSDLLSTMLGGFANVELPLGQGSVQPFLLGGLGAVQLASDATTGGIDFSETKPSLNLGAGVRFRLGGIHGMIEARLNNVPGSNTAGYFKDVRTVPVTFGLVF